jgi:hypothetical protein
LDTKPKLDPVVPTFLRDFVVVLVVLVPFVRPVRISGLIIILLLRAQDFSADLSLNREPSEIMKRAYPRSQYTFQYLTLSSEESGIPPPLRGIRPQWKRCRREAPPRIRWKAGEVALKDL